MTNKSISDAYASMNTPTGKLMIKCRVLRGKVKRSISDGYYCVRAAMLAIIYYFITYKNGFQLTLMTNKFTRKLAHNYYSYKNAKEAAEFRRIKLIVWANGRMTMTHGEAISLANMFHQIKNPNAMYREE